MYISKIELKNIRCFEELSIDLERDGDPILWTTILGDNATGKTTLLRSIAIGLCDGSSAAGLLKESEEGYIRRDEPDRDAKIIICLRDEKDPSKTFRITTTIEPVKTKKGKSFEKLSQTTDPLENFPWDDIFACAYGAGRGTSGTADVAGYSTISAVYNLFNYAEGLQNHELSIYRVKPTFSEDIVFSILKKSSLGIVEKFALTPSGITADGPWGQDMPLRDLADGFKSSFLWITDFLGWAVSHNSEIRDSEDVSGIVMIDEIEQHLHPKWQRDVVPTLNELFPTVQFITTSHSPLVAAGTSDIDNAILFNLIFDDARKIIGEGIPAISLRGLRADQFLTHPIFGLPTALGPKIGDRMVRFRELFVKEPRDADEEVEFEKLREILKQDIADPGETEEDRKVQRELKELLAGIDDILNQKDKADD